MHRAGCPVITPGPAPPPRQRPALPHDLITIVRRITANPMRPLREDPAGEGERAVILLAQAAIYAAHVGIDGPLLCDAANAVIKLTYDEMGGET